LRELAGPETPEGLLFRWILESPIESLDFIDFRHHTIEDRDLRQIGIFGDRPIRVCQINLFNG
jgi:hypothetical protein